jgi:hypothetical protein
MPFGHFMAKRAAQYGAGYGRRYEHMIKILTTSLIFLASSSAFASAPIDSIYITKKNAATHGFNITSSESDGYYEINWSGPQSVNDCYPAQSTFGIFNSQDEHALGYGSTIRFKTQEKPSGFFNQLNNDDIALLTISYFCTDNPSKGLMFIMKSIKGKLITNLSSTAR